ncbi:uncharacterized protein EV420DRAFT_1277904, partial [Desarmillaria tabescens]
DPFTQPAIDVSYFFVYWDLDVQITSSRMSRTILTSPPLSDLSTGDSIPGKSGPEDGGSEEDWRSCTTSGFAAVSHSIGSLAMIKRNLGGALKVSF